MPTVPDQDQSFPSWAFSTVSRLRKAVGIGAVLAAAVSIRNLQPQTWTSQKSLGDLNQFLQQLGPQRSQLAFIQAAACLLLAVLVPKPSLSVLERRKDVDPTRLLTARKAGRRIHNLVMAVYFAWSIYYLVTGISLREPQTLFDRAVSVTLNTLPSLMLFWLYIELAEFTIDEPIPTRAPKRKPIDNTPSVDAAFYRMVSLGVFALVIVPVWYAFGKNKGGTIAVFDIASSCLNGVALALVVGRLGSKLIDPGSITLGLLYFYAVIQTTAATFSNDAIGQVLATTIALPLKVLLWLVIVWALTTGIISEYVHDLRVLLIREHPSERSKID
jgi:hypothetical protein